MCLLIYAQQNIFLNDIDISNIQQNAGQKHTIKAANQSSEEVKKLKCLQLKLQIKIKYARISHQTTFWECLLQLSSESFHTSFKSRSGRATRLQFYLSCCMGVTLGLYLLGQSI
jgi:hypothetical protein